MEPIRSPIRCLSEFFFPGVILPGREAEQPPPFAAEVKNKWRYISPSPCSFMNASGVDSAAADPAAWGPQNVTSIKIFMVYFGWYSLLLTKANFE